MSTWTVTRRIVTAFAVCAVVMTAVVIVYFVGFARLQGSHRVTVGRSERALDVAAAIGDGADLYAVVADAEANLDFAITRKAWAESKAEAAARLSKLTAAAETDADRNLVAEAAESFNRLVVLFEQKMLPVLVAKDSASSLGFEDEAASNEARKMAAPLKRLAADLRVRNDASNREFDTTARTTSMAALVCAGFGMATSLAALTALIIKLNRKLMSVVTPLTESAGHVVVAAGQVKASSQNLSNGALEQAASLQETSASMEEMASMTRQNAENATHAARLVTAVAQEVTDSNTALTGMVSSMAAIKESSNKVAKIIRTIDEIAFQTNILALNAAVEAARAGEAGMGFAVVADEVRNLAQRSAQAAKDTAELIEESIVRSQEGAAKVQEVATAIGAITGSVTKVKGIVHDVLEASRQQSTGIDQVAQAMVAMEKVTQTTAATAEESAASSEALNSHAEEAMAAVGDLEALVGRRQSVHSAVEPPAATASQPPARRMPVPALRAVARPDPDAPSATGTHGSF